MLLSELSLAAPSAPLPFCWDFGFGFGLRYCGLDPGLQMHPSRKLHPYLPSSIRLVELYHLQALLWQKALIVNLSVYVSLCLPLWRHGLAM